MSQSGWSFLSLGDRWKRDRAASFFAKIGSIFSLCWSLLSLLLKLPFDIKFLEWQLCPSSLLQVLCRLLDTPPTLCFLWSCPATSLSSTGPSEASPCWPLSTTEQLSWQQRCYCAAFVHSVAETLVKRPFGQQVSLVTGETALRCRAGLVIYCCYGNAVTFCCGRTLTWTLIDSDCH